MAIPTGCVEGRKSYIGPIIVERKRESNDIIRLWEKESSE